MWIDPEIIVPTFLSAGIIGTTLSLAIYTLLINIEIFQTWRNPTNIALIPPIFFLFSLIFTLLYIISEEQLLLRFSFIALSVAVGLIFILIIVLLKLPPIEDIRKLIERARETEKIYKKT